MSYTITAIIRVPNYLFTSDGESYTGRYQVRLDPFDIDRLVMIGFVGEEEFPTSLYFRNTVLAVNPMLKQSNSEVLSKNFQNSKEKLEKIITFTNSK